MKAKIKVCSILAVVVLEKCYFYKQLLPLMWLGC